MNIINKLERKFGRYAITNIMLYLTVLYTVGLVVQYMMPSFYIQYLSLNVYQILKGQVWRIITWLMYPPSSGILAIVMIFVYYNIGNSLENYWGDFKFNVFILSGIIFHIIAAFIIYAIYRLDSVYMLLTPRNLNLSILLAFMLSFPDAQFLLFFFIPIKAKILGIVYVVLTVIEFIMGSVANKIEIGVSLLNVIAFMAMTGMLQSAIWRIKNKWGRR